MSESPIAPFLEANKRWAAAFAETDSDLLAKFGTAWQEPPILYVLLFNVPVKYIVNTNRDKQLVRLLRL